MRRGDLSYRKTHFARCLDLDIAIVEKCRREIWDFYSNVLNSFHSEFGHSVSKKPNLVYVQNPFIRNNERVQVIVYPKAESYHQSN